MPKNLSRALRFQILERDGFRCFYCRSGHTELHVDHVIPRSRGGVDQTWNLAAACPPCNLSKTNTVPSDKVVTAVRRADASWLHQKRGDDYGTCMFCDKPVNLSDYEDKTLPIQCVTCNEIVCDAHDIGWKSGYQRGRRDGVFAGIELEQKMPGVV